MTASSPGVAFVAKSFLKPPKASVVEWDIPNTRHTFALDSAPSTSEPSSIDIAYYEMGEGPRVLLVHGWAGQSTDLASIASGLISAGFSVVALDLPAHGQSQGRQNSIPLSARAVLGVAERVGGLRAAIAHSFGGPVLLHAMTQGLAPQSVVFVSPPSSYADQARKVAAMANLSSADTAELLKAISSEIGVAIEEVSFQHEAPTMTVPALFLHSKDDRIVTTEESTLSAKAWPGARHHLLDGLGHRKILDDPEVVDSVVDFIRG